MIFNMPGGDTSNPVDKFLTDQKALETKRQELIKELLAQKEAAIKEFDDKLAKLGHHDGAHRRSHHRKAAPDKKA